MTTLEEIYTREWVEGDFAELRPEFFSVAEAIHRQFGFCKNNIGQTRPNVVDVGCGPGMLIERLRERGWLVHGIEGSQHCIDFAAPSARERISRDRIEHLVPAAISVPFPDVPVMRGPASTSINALCPADLVICTEVAEHLDASLATHLVELLAAPGCPIVFTAAPPGQDGHHHVNCQPREYWLDLFARHGVIEDERATGELRARWRGLLRLNHMVRNVMVLT